MPEQTITNPFELMINPKAVVQAVEHSERLGGLQRRVYRPLDKPLIAKTHDDSGELEAEDPSEEDDALHDDEPLSPDV